MIDGNKIKFPVYYENGEPSNYELGLLTNQSSYQSSLFTTDEFGRNTTVKLEGTTGYVFLDLKPYLMEEKIQDCKIMFLQTNFNATIDKVSAFKSTRRVEIKI